MQQVGGTSSSPVWKWELEEKTGVHMEALSNQDDGQLERQR